MNSVFCGFMLGMTVTVWLLLIGYKMTEINISDEELYRFCIERKIDLPDCKIPPLPLEKAK